MGEPIRPKAEAAAPSFEMTKEAFEAALVDAAAKGAALAVAQMASAPSQGVGGGMAEIADRLALSISELTHQGDPRSKPLDPKVIAQRKAAEDRMHELILEAQALEPTDPRRPRWKTRSKCIFNDMIIDPYRTDPATKRAVPREFVWCGPPNIPMEPLNEFAKEIKEAFLAFIGNDINNTKWTARRTAWLTNNGLLVEGIAPQRRAVAEIAGLETNAANGLEIFDNTDPNAKTVRILGTAHAPAQRHSAGFA
jgi:hypothetical protein